ncbi:MAG: PfkB family carbohydrate kinase, partial [Chloroflexi bacterium]|nr:PfkB family carbohydrate kinase [Chloroflexota bacterium]
RLAHPCDGSKPSQGLVQSCSNTLPSAAGAGWRIARRMGDDDLSNYTLDEFAREGVDCSPVLRRSSARPIHSRIIVDRTNGQRSIMASFAGVQWRQAHEISAELIGNCRVLFVDHHAVDGGLKAIEIANAKGIPVVADIERESEPRAVELAPLVDHLIVGISFALRKTGETEPARMVQALRALSAGKACCVVTAGERGCWYSGGESDNSVIHQPAYPVQVVDTTGCGDVFHGAYAACIARAEPIDTAVKVASAAAAIKAAHPGGRAGIPNRAAVDAFLSHNQ